jgi:hypothetical protein
MVDLSVAFHRGDDVWGGFFFSVPSGGAYVGQHYE